MENFLKILFRILRTVLYFRQPLRFFHCGPILLTFRFQKSKFNPLFALDV
jgi:hypothetical protein